MSQRRALRNPTFEQATRRTRIRRIRARGDVSTAVDENEFVGRVAVGIHKQCRVYLSKSLAAARLTRGRIDEQRAVCLIAIAPRRLLCPGGGTSSAGGARRAHTIEQGA